MPRDGVRNDSDSTEESFAPSRRSYLKAAGAAAVSVPLLSGEGAAATERHGISFDNVVDMVEAGADPNGNEACDGALQSAAGSNTLLKFPSGTYKFTEKNVISGGNVGILGEGDVTFTVPSDFDDKLLAINGGTGALVENITIDQSGATPNIQVAPDDGLEVHDVTITGQSLESSDSAEDAFTPMVRSSGGEGTVSNLVAHNEGRMGAYARTGVWIGQEHAGTVTLRNCNVEGFSNNGVYASRTPGVVKVEGGTYKNNDLSQVRIGSSGSYVDGATIETDVSDSRSPNPEDMLNGSGIRLESDRGGSGAVVRNCDIRVGPNVNADGGIQIFGNYGEFTIEDTRVEYNPQGYSIRAKSGGSGGATLRNVSVTGDATDWVGVLIEDRPGTTVEGCCIQQTGSGRTGLALDNCDGSTVTNCTINASAQAVRINGGGVSVSGIEKSGTCPAPSLGSSSYSGSSDDSSTDESSSDDTESSSDDSDDSSEDSSSDSSDEESTESSDSSSDESDSSDDSDDSSEDSSSDSSEDDSSDSSKDDGAGSDEELSGDIDESEVPEPSDSANFVVTDTDSSGGRIPYEVQTSGDIEKAGTGDATQDSNDEISGKTASGGVNEWRDAYEYEGEIVALEIEDRATIKLDGDEKTITVMGDDDSGTDYSLEVTGTLEHADDSTDPIADDGSSVSGGVGSFRDEYTYTGSLLQASIEDSVSITTDPETLEG
ncbi:right-handed parallel beta-helix repeat-containing protein [Halococcus sediminicola]|uniref:right-handed parallel beta-helix repeat-containing protein n=1 Tax=Halococcus sediminicola TaxID=1264579 RepID=UPI0006786AE8|nr:right-handed parallel beta-helix repeat-containing protein [Halococcus sediminicola]